MNEQVVLTLLRITKSTARPKKMKKNDVHGIMLIKMNLIKTTLYVTPLTLGDDRKTSSPRVVTLSWHKWGGG